MNLGRILALLTLLLLILIGASYVAMPFLADWQVNQGQPAVPVRIVP